MDGQRVRHTRCVSGAESSWDSKKIRTQIKNEVIELSETSYDETMNSLRQARNILDEIYRLLMDVQHNTNDFVLDKHELCAAALQNWSRLADGLYRGAPELAASAWKLKGAN